jgi:hypothetical protein
MGQGMLTRLEPLVSFYCYPVCKNLESKDNLSFFYWEANRTILILPISAQNIKMGDEDTKTANGTKVKKS